MLFFFSLAAFTSAPLSGGSFETECSSYGLITLSRALFVDLTGNVFLYNDYPQMTRSPALRVPLKVLVFDTSTSRGKPLIVPCELNITTVALASRLSFITYLEENGMNKTNVVALPVANRTISVVHRVKQTVDGEARPTFVAIKETGGSFNRFDLATEREEFDFITATGKYESLGLRAGDTVITTLGGSGDRLSFAMSRVLLEVGGVLHRIPGYHLKNAKETPLFAALDESDRNDVTLLHSLWSGMARNFFECRIRDRETIRISELYRVFKDAQLERMKCANRLRARLVGALFLSEEGKYPEGKIEDWFDAQKANDPIFKVLEQEEKSAKATLEKAINATRIADIFSDVVGCGPVIVGGLVNSIGDIRRFSGPEKLTSYMLGLNSSFNETGRFPRARRGERTNWNRTARQTLYQLADQFNRRPESEWGQKLLANKAFYRKQHPDTLIIEKNGTQETGRQFVLLDDEVKCDCEYFIAQGLSVCRKKGGKYSIVVGAVGEEIRGTQRFYDGHIHRMAIWKTLREFVHFLYGAWTELEKAEYVPVEKKVRAKKAA